MLESTLGDGEWLITKSIRGKMFEDEIPLGTEVSIICL